ncbi:MAG: hypothetical protein QOD74_280 [Variibacter sp.]|jgi:predicted PurR-regulated permease PerM|nr:hypothetical protein [Variibacter sp.]
MNQQPSPAQFKEKAASAQRKEMGPAGAPQVEVTSPIPPEQEQVWEALSHFAIVGMAFIAMVGALYFGRSIIMPVVAGLIIGVTLSPLMKFAASYKVPHAVTALILVMVFFGLLYLAATLLVGAAADWLSRGPELGGIIKEKFRWIEGPLAGLKQATKTVSESGGSPTPTVAVETGTATLAGQALSVVTPAISEFILFFGTLLFFLLGIDKMRRQLITYFDTRAARLRVVRIWNDVEQNLITYLSTVTVINVGLGIATSFMLYLIGFPNPIAFGVLACLLNYIPYVGPAMLVATLAAVGLIAMHSLSSALLAPALFVAIATVEGHFITPAVVGKRLTLSPFLVFLALAFWTWLWGPIGTLMATPLLIVGLVVLSHLFPNDEHVLPK